MNQSFEEMVEQYRKMVYGIALTHTGNKADADDVFQETFLTCYQKFDTLRDEEHCKAWLIRTTMNISKRYTSSLWKNRVTLWGEDDREAQYTFESQEESELFHKLRKLPDKYRIVIQLFYMEELKITEIAEILKISVSAVKVRLNRGRNMLKIRLEKEEL